MFAFELAKQFRKSRSQQRFISFISMSSTVGIALGCFVLILLLSVMNGFEKELTSRVLSVIPHGELYSVDNRGIDNLEAQRYRLEQDNRIARITPYTKLTGMLQFKGELKAVELTGIIPSENTSQYKERVTDKQWAAFTAEPKGVLVGQGIAEKLQLSVGDPIKVLVPVTTNDLSFKAPKTVSLIVSGFLSIGGELDNLVGLMHLDTASNAAELQSRAQGLQFTFYDAYSANTIMREIGYSYPQAVYMSDWTRTQGHLYNDIQLVRAVVYIALILVIGVACFNIVSSLVMAVREKQAAIAILKTMGATDALIRSIFIFQGAINGVVGITVGVALALLVTPNLSSIVLFVENALGIEVLSGDIYFIDFLPSELQWQDVLITTFVALSLCIMATLYPAQKAAKISPSSSLH
ncbi:lipoprotein-releasing system transmembrane subunit LolC [Alteromonas sp. MB-3u-76]|uniref:lipoprotein-releasing ABC transporter permease subunit n=1 Tax=Alteromonas sp. MB-3u-76 TaxID=2058133 RepID=UPI000C31743D|nr:lipoprotein-releasing ABC transporter permease subunit [Alteromonas sp. MB-3u-76]AUC88773.1 lipoprotein-releasing system transmembrane subunit LolC [Alteromonas sp. MB-3u-76]